LLREPRSHEIELTTCHGTKKLAEFTVRLQWTAVSGPRWEQWGGTFSKRADGTYPGAIDSPSSSGGWYHERFDLRR
jgi:hypothetical protein